MRDKHIILDYEKSIEIIKTLEKENTRLANEITVLKIENQKLNEQLKIKHDGFMASIEEKCELAEENQKLKEKIKNIVTYAYGTDMLVIEYEQLCKIAEVE